MNTISTRRKITMALPIITFFSMMFGGMGIWSFFGASAMLVACELDRLNCVRKTVEVKCKI